MPWRLRRFAFPVRGMSWRTMVAVLLCGVLALAAPAMATDEAPRAPDPRPPFGPVLVFGGAGQLGSEIVRELVGRGYPVAVFVRRTSDRSRLAGLSVRFIEGDVLVEADVQRAFESARFHTVIDALGRSESGVEFYATSGRLIARWAAQTGVSRAILHSSVGVGASRAAYPPTLFAERSPLFVAKEAGENALIESGVDYTIIRNAVLRELPAGVPDRAQLFEDPRRFGVVSRRGLARLTLGCVDNPACARRVYHAVDEGMALPR
jgi:uncharacterized protein YbjT (DUF2867 family)